MGSHATVSSERLSHHNSYPELSEYARKLITYSIEFRENRPSASPSLCMTMAVGKLTDEYGDDKDHLASVAMKEVAAKLIFG